MQREGLSEEVNSEADTRLSREDQWATKSRQREQSAKTLRGKELDAGEKPQVGQ